LLSIARVVAVIVAPYFSPPLLQRLFLCVWLIRIMIAKRVMRPRASSDFARLGTYVLGQGQKGNQASAADQTFDYILADQAGGRVGAVRITNCNADTPALAILEILATQSLNKRSRGDRTYHLVVSFEPGERPAPAQIETIENELCAAIGLAGHQRISALHLDRAHLHLHIAINKVVNNVRSPNIEDQRSCGADNSQSDQNEPLRLVSTDFSEMPPPCVPNADDCDQDNPPRNGGHLHRLHTEALLAAAIVEVMSLNQRHENSHEYDHPHSKAGVAHRSRLSTDCGNGYEVCLYANPALIHA
jgi:hypothetical protein